MTRVLPASAHLAWWGTSWLRGHASPDDLMDRVPGASTLLTELAGWRRAGCAALGLALPVEGDPLGLAGPATFTARAYEAREAVLVLGQDRGLVPAAPPTCWEVHPGRRGVVPDVGEADGTLRTGLVTAASRLAELDVARWRPQVADALIDLRHRPHVDHPPGVPAACVDLASRALQAASIVAVARDDDGASVSAHEIDARRGVLDDLDRAARRALVAACSPDAWPPEVA